MNSSLFFQPSSFAGYAALGAGLLNIVAQQGLPTGAPGWIGLGMTFLGGLAAILKSDGSGNAAPAPAK